MCTAEVDEPHGLLWLGLRVLQASSGTCAEPSRNPATVRYLLPVEDVGTWMLEKVGLVMGLMGLIMACHGGLQGILSGLTKSTDHPRKDGV